MKCNDRLREEVGKLIKRARQNRQSSSENIQRQMADWEARFERCMSLSNEIKDGCLVPALQALAEEFPNSQKPVHVSETSVSIGFRASEELPANASLAFRFTHDTEARKIRVASEIQIVPILMDYERFMSVEIDAECPDRPMLEEFIHAQVLRFVKEYLRTTDPNSEYQKMNQVRDSVCGMRLLRMQASHSSLLEGRKHYFCCRGCRDRFEATPEPYVEAFKKIVR
jgi:YHS domain-containing protein